LGLFCPITSHAKGYPFEVALPEGLQVRGAALSDQIRNLDWRARQASFMERAPDLVVVNVLQKLKTLLNPVA
jgi:mRNA interferase MazF